MGLDDYVNPETGLMTAATAAAVSPRARELLRRGAVYGLAGAMRAGDVVAAAARGAVRGARESVAQENGRASATRTAARSSSSAAGSGSRSGGSRRGRSGTSRSGGGTSRAGGTTGRSGTTKRSTGSQSRSTRRSSGSSGSS